MATSLAVDLAKPVPLTQDKRWRIVDATIHPRRWPNSSAG
jgi:hypothetical protein